MSLPQSNRILRSAEFRNVYQTGTRISCRYFVAFCLRNDGAAEPSRFGFTVPRAIGKAVQRNRIKRRMREAVRRYTELIPIGWSVVFNPRRTVLEAAFEDLCREVARILARCKES